MSAEDMGMLEEEDEDDVVVVHYSPGQKKVYSPTAPAAAAGGTASPGPRQTQSAGDTASSRSPISDDWVSVSKDDFDIYDFVKKYATTP
jgi:hypothetical protein